MTTKPVTGIKIKDGKLVRVRPFMAGAKSRKADRQEKNWKAKSKPKKWTDEDRQFVRVWNGLLDVAVIAAHLDRPLESVMAVAKAWKGKGK